MKDGKGEGIDAVLRVTGDLDAGERVLCEGERRERKEGEKEYAREEFNCLIKLNL